MGKAKKAVKSSVVVVEPPAGADSPVANASANANGTRSTAEACPNLPLQTLSFDGSLGVEALSRTEWLLTNDMGGFAMGTASGVPTRRYHGMLVGATMPPVGRVLALHSMLDTLVVNPESVDKREIALSTYAFKGPEFQPAVLHPDGASRLVKFEKGLSCRWTYEVDIAPGERVRVTKELFVYERVNACAISYSVERITKGSTPIQLHARPMTGLRDMHALNSREFSGGFASSHGPTSARVVRDGRELRLLCDSAVFFPRESWWNSLFYRIEQERGQDCYEDVYSPGYFLLDVPANERGGKCVVQASLNEPGEASHAMLEAKPALALRQARLGKQFAAISSRKALSDTDQRTLAALISAADDFVVARSVRGNDSVTRPTDSAALTQISVIAGYPWFGDWGRDTCVALPGLMLATARFDDARRTLTTFAKARKDGIVPNLFNDRTGHAEYNTVDASLWFIHGACAYSEASGDRAIFESDLLPACLDIVSAYRRGTMFNIAMDPMDKLITAGSDSTQLTWMDAKRDGVVFTPRFGKAVEINALWYSALKLLSEHVRPRDPTAGANLNDLADAVGKSFRKSFWNAGGGCLYDCLTPSDDGSWRPSGDLRPNQLFAVSLPNSPLTAEEKASVLRIVRERLLTPMGIRTLAAGDWRYKARYEGNLFERDAAYHNGTAWPWLLGAHAEGVLRVGNFSDAAKREARAVLGPAIETILSPRAGSGVCAGQLAEIFDAEEPQRPQGCTAQAWSVAEVLRVWVMTL